MQNLSRPKIAGKTDRNESAQEHTMNMKNNRLNRASRTVRTVTADSPPSTQTAKRARPLDG
jgi:hypothetical protein